MTNSPVLIAYYLGFLGGGGSEDFNENDLTQAQRHVMRTISATEEMRSRNQQELRLRLALHFCPREALDHDPMRPESRATLIEKYMIEKHGFNDNNSQIRAIAQRVATLINQWQTGSSGGDSWQFNELYRRQKSRCAHCHAPLDSPPETLASNDVYKPYSDSRGPHAEIDHVEAASRFGDDGLDNLQLLCQLCNRAKSNDLTIPAKTEFKHAASPIEDVPESYRARVLYHVIKQSGRRCSRCKSDDTELTIRPIHEDGLYVRSNLEPVCVDCV